MLQRSHVSLGTKWKNQGSGVLSQMGADKPRPLLQNSLNVRGKIEIGYPTLQYGSLVSSDSMVFSQDFCLKAFQGLHYGISIIIHSCKAMKSSLLLGPFCGSDFWGFSLLKIQLGWVFLCFKLQTIVSSAMIYSTLLSS